MKEKQLMTSNGHYRNFGTEIYRIAVSKLMKAVIDLRWHRLWPKNSVLNEGRPEPSPLRRLNVLPQKFNMQVRPHWFIVLLTLGISLDLLPDIPSSTTSMTTCKQPCRVKKQIIYKDAAIS